MNYGDARLPQRYWDKVYPEPNTGCWLWGASHSKQTGYGWYNEDGKARNAHRIMCRAAHGEPSAGQYAIHACDLRICVSPEHLRWGWPIDNTRDMVARGRSRTGSWQAARTHCPCGEPYSGANLYISPTNGGRNCRACKRRQWREWNARRSGR